MRTNEIQCFLECLMLLCLYTSLFADVFNLFLGKTLILWNLLTTISTGVPTPII